MQHTEDAGDEDECGQCRACQAADDGAPQRRILLGTFAHSKRHWAHADNHGKSRHDDGPKACKARLNSGLQRITVNDELLLGERHHKNAVGRCHAHAHNGAHQRGNTERGTCHEQEDNDPGQCGRKGRDDNERVQPRLEVNHDQQVNQDDGERDPGEQSSKDTSAE
jgi:hypothetical protein